LSKTRLILQNTQEKDGTLHLEARLHPERGTPISAWYRVPSSVKGQVTAWADPFVVAMIFPVMQLGKPLVVEGPVSPSLLFNLEEFMAAWSVWRPERYRTVDITAEQEEEHPAPAEKGNALMAFSGGVDSCFTAWRHRNGLAGRRNQDIQAGIFIHGLDIPLSRRASYERLKERNRLILSSIDMSLIPVTTNYREMLVGWGDSHASALLSTLMLFQKKYDTALLGSSRPYFSTDPKIVWGSNATSDPLLSSDSFRVLYDGARFSRLEKLSVVSRWPEALQNLHVCWEGMDKHENCCRCEKCIRTILMFCLLGHAQPPCFPKPLRDEDIRSLKPHGEVSHRSLMVLVHEAEKRGLSSERWVITLKELAGRKTLTQRFRQTARNTLLHRGMSGSLLRSALYRLRSLRQRGD